MTGRQNVNAGGNEQFGSRPVHRLLFVVCGVVCLTPSLLLGQIQDNSFLVEEAYNQERGVVQHINTFQHSSGNWAYGFTQEWPLGGIGHQLSYTIPVERTSDNGAGVGDIGLNYRYQLLGSPETSTVVVGRFTLLLPTGDEDAGTGAGGVGLQAALPVTVVVDRHVATHWNVGATLVPSAGIASGPKETAASFNLGASAVWLVQPALNFLVEAVWSSTEEVGAGGSIRQETAYLNPGVRFALDLGDLQVVPGFAYTIGLNEAAGGDGLFVYLSFEHPFQRQ